LKKYYLYGYVLLVVLFWIFTFLRRGWQRKLVYEAHLKNGNMVELNRSAELFQILFYDFHSIRFIKKNLAEMPLNVQKLYRQYTYINYVIVLLFILIFTLPFFAYKFANK